MPAREALHLSRRALLPLSIRAPPPPHTSQVGIHGHVFVNGGSLVQGVGPRRSLQNAWHEFATSFRWSVVSSSRCSLQPGGGAGGHRARALCGFRGRHLLQRLLFVPPQNL